MSSVRWQPANDRRLPGAGTKRWVIRRKAEVVAAVRGACFRSKRRVTAIRDRRRILSWQYRSTVMVWPGCARLASAISSVIGFPDHSDRAGIVAGVVVWRAVRAWAPWAMLRARHILPGRSFEPPAFEASAAMVSGELTN